MLGFITNAKPWRAFAIPMTMLNVGPPYQLLVFVTGHGRILWPIKIKAGKTACQKLPAEYGFRFIFGPIFVIALCNYL